MLTALAHDAALGAPAENASSAVREIFREHAARVWRSLVHLGVAPRDADDATQEVFLVVFRQLDRGTHPENVRGWLYGICWRVAAAHRRKAHRRREVPTEDLEPIESPDSGPASNVEERRRLQRLQHALSNLNENQRVVFVLYEIEELTMQEVADVVGCSINTAFSRLYAARQRVAKELGVEVPREVWKR